MDYFIGRRLDGRYQINELIGMGGMANVYKATDLLENRTVAVKVLRDEFLGNEELVRRFKNESKAIGLLSHPNIVRVFDVNFSDTVQYIVMEFIDGITLKQYIDAVKPLSWKDAVHFIVQILRALQHAHDRGIVHRDIKPQNIMLLEDGSIKVMDFGIARFSRSETRTITDKAIGSVHYISPEQAKGDITDAKADLYSVGVMMYEMLTGSLPFESETPVQVAIKQISDEPLRPRELVQDIPEGLEEITLKAMAKDPAKRYQSASQMLRDIDDFKKNPSIVFEYKYFTDPNPTRYVDKAKAEGAGVVPKKSSKKSPKRKKSQYLIYGIASACVLCTVILVLFMLGAFEGRHKDVVLENFVGQTLESVMANEKYKGFHFEVVEDYNDTYDVGIIFEQTPLPGKTVKDNSTVTLKVSLGSKEVEVPNVVNMKSGEAQKTLQSFGLVVKQESRSDSNYEQNIVIDMSPKAGEIVKSGSTVTIYVNMLSTGDVAEVPQLVGLTYNNALKALTEANLMRGEVKQVPSDKPKGTVLEQSIPKGTKVAASTKIDLVISDGTPTSRVYSIPVNMPAAPAPTPPDPAVGYTAKVYVNGSLVNTTPFDPGYAGGSWSVSVTVTANDTIIKVTIDDKPYAEYKAQMTQDKYDTITAPSGVFPTVTPPAGIAPRPTAETRRRKPVVR